MIEDSIRAKAISSPLIQSLIRDRFYLNENHSTETDYVVLTVISDPSNIDCHLQPEQSQALVQFDCYSKNPLKAKQILKAIDTEFHRKAFKDNDVKVQFALKQDRVPDYEVETGIFMETIDYLFYYNEV